MSDTARQWSLGAKLALIGLPFLLLGLLTSALTLWVSAQLDGAAAAVNEAGRLRMQTYRIAWLAGRGERAALDEQVAMFDHSLALLRTGAPERPLVVPWDDSVRARFAAVEAAWQDYRARWPRDARGSAAAADAPAARTAPAPEAATVALVARIDALVRAVEAHLAHYTSLLHLLQLALLVLGVIGAAVLVVTGYRFVIEPVVALKQAIDRLHAGDLGVRVAPASRDEFGALADGFNDMAGKLQALYRNLEARVSEKTAELKDQSERLRTLYEVSTLVTHSGALAELAGGFVTQVRHAVHADAAALRWADDDSRRFVMLASDGLPDGLAREEHCIRTGDCHCGIAPGQDGARVIPIHTLAGDSQLSCRHAGWSTVVTVPIRLKERLLGELDLFFHAHYRLGEAERTLLDALTAHLASGIENLRVVALEKEAAVAQERGYIARELHDSIAQSLAFLKIQVQLMRDAMARGDRAAMTAVLAEIELGVKESHGNVRELLLNFRTRTDAEDIEAALRTTLRKFEQQTGIPAALELHGQGLPLAPDVQVQALHIVQEALSNVRKHAQAGHVRLEVWRQPVWRFEVRDDGVGFDTRRDDHGESHVGLRIMAERAERLGARFSVESRPGRGTRVRLTLPPVAAAPAIGPAAIPAAIPATVAAATAPAQTPTVH